MAVPFKVETPETSIADLKNRLLNTRWPEVQDGSGWKYGPDPGYMEELLAYWQNDFDWRKQESLINSFPNYKTVIDGITIHFIHVRGKGKKNIPLVITHGWPGSFLEMLKLVPLLTEPSITGVAFDLVIPSIPGFGFSQRLCPEGMNVRRMASLWISLMQELGYEKFGAQGGDFGAGVCTAMALSYPEKLTGIHLNYIPGSYVPYLEENEHFSPEEIAFIKSAADWYSEKAAYAQLQRTTPLTPAYGLNDSPAGLAAWLVEKFYEWGDCNGNIESRFSKDELLANISLYWFTETIYSSCRLYFENSRVPFHFKKGEFVSVPVGIARFPKEEPFPPRSYIERGYNVRHWSDMPGGGHFAALEEPEALAADISTFFKFLDV
jgi:pimeloyl-ACP methyl ester carboxylesterase